MNGVVFPPCQVRSLLKVAARMRGRFLLFRMPPKSQGSRNDTPKDLAEHGPHMPRMWPWANWVMRGSQRHIKA